MPLYRRYNSTTASTTNTTTTVFVSTRNLSLGAKAELASGKHVTYLDDDTRLNLIHLLSGNTSTPV